VLCLNLSEKITFKGGPGARVQLITITTTGSPISAIMSSTSRLYHYTTGSLQIQPNKFLGDLQDTFNKVPAGFLH